MKNPFIIYVDTESLLEKIDTCHCNPEKSSATKVKKHTASGYSLFSHFLFDATKGMYDYYGGKDCMKKAPNNLKKYARKIFIYEEKKWYY